MLKFVIVLCLIYPIYSVEVCNRSNSQDITAFSPNITSKGVIDVGGVKYSKNQYYTDDKTGAIRGCDFCLGKKSICVKKCCDFGYGYNPELKRCVKVTEEFDPPVWNEYRVMKGKSVLDMFKFVPGKQNCTSPEYRIQIGRVATSHLKWDGSLYVDMPNQIPPWTIYRPDQYCVDTFVFQDSSGAVTTRLDALICFAAEQEDHHYLQTSVCMLISCVFILATCAVYAFLPELRNLHGRVLMAYLLCLFVAFAMLATMQILILIDNIFAGTCLTMTFIIYFSLLSAFFWLNVMCFDIWWTFSGKRGLSLEKLSTRGRFFAYAAYAFSVPSILTILIASLEFSGLPPHPLLPMIRHNGCFLSGNGKLLYLYGPIVLLCCANLIFFVLTAVKIAQIKQQTSVLKSRESSTHDQHRNDKQRLLLYVKLFSVMGINWILEVIGSVYPQAQMIWRFTDAYNVLIGVIIFIIFVCKRKIFHLMKKRIKERFQRRTSDIGEIKKFEQMQQRRFKYGPRDSVETLRSTIYMDSDGSIKNDKISKL